MPLYVQRIRYPPFEQDNMVPNRVPISEAIVDSGDLEISEFTIGNDSGWFVEWRKKSEDDKYQIIESDVSTLVPKFISRSRLGWYINPDPLHNISRRLILPTVSLLIVSLFIHSIEPWLLNEGIIGKSIAGSISFGPLDYPKLLFYTFPLFLLPLVFRTIANFRDMSRQAKINQLSIEDPIEFLQVERASISLEISDTIEFKPLRARVQVGIAVPERSAIIHTLGRIEGGQPSPGLSTKLPDKRIASDDEVGIGVGESTPMQLSTRRSVILEPMRILESGSWKSGIYNRGRIDLNLPELQWPGTVYSSLIAVHWEIVIEFLDSDDSIIKWVSPLIMPQSNEKVSVTKTPTRSGRSELSNF